jgi:uncharacterized protein YuzE
LDKIRVYYDDQGKTLTVWLDEPGKEEVCEEADDDTILMKDAEGSIIGFEKLNVTLEPGNHRITVEVINLPGDAA